MESSRRLPLALLWIMLEFVNAAYVGVLVDDADPRITYTGGNWTAVDHCQECGVGLDISRVEAGSYHMVHQPNQTAQFQFTGVGVKVHGVVPAAHGRQRRPPNVSFTVDGTETLGTMMNSSTNGSLGGPGPTYNKTLFLADNLPDGPHTLSIQTHDNSLFILDYLTYSTNATERTVTAAAANESITDSASSSSSTFPYDQSGPSSSGSGAQPTVVGAVVGGIFGAFLIAGIIGLWFIRRANRRRGLRKGSKGSAGRTPPGRAPFDKKDLPSGIFGVRRKANNNNNNSGDSSSGERGGRNRGGGTSGKRKDDHKRQRVGIPVEYEYSGPKPVHTAAAMVPLTTTRRMEALSAAAANDGRGGYRSPLGTFVSTTSSSGGHGDGDGKIDIIHALTTDTPQEAHPAPLYADGLGYGHGHGHGPPTSPPPPPPPPPQTRRPNTADAMRAARQWEQLQERRPNTADSLRDHGGGVGARAWPGMGVDARPFSTGSTLEVDGVLERVMQNHSTTPGGGGVYGSRGQEEPSSPPAVYFSDHPFRTMGS